MGMNPVTRVTTRVVSSEILYMIGGLEVRKIVVFAVISAIQAVMGNVACIVPSYLQVLVPQQRIFESIIEILLEDVLFYTCQQLVVVKYVDRVRIDLLCIVSTHSNAANYGSDGCVSGTIRIV